jgi:hypothetical protein
MLLVLNYIKIPYSFYVIGLYYLAILFLILYFEGEIEIKKRVKKIM